MRRTEERIPTQVTKGLVNWNSVPLIQSKNVHPAQAELSDGAGAPEYQDVSATTTTSCGLHKGVQIRFSCSTATLLIGFTKMSSVCGNRQLEELSAARYRLLRLALIKN